MFVLYCHLSKGSVIASYQLVLKNDHTLDELTKIMKDHLESNNGKMGSFEVKAGTPGSIQFSGTLISNVPTIVSIMFCVPIS